MSDDIQSRALAILMEAIEKPQSQREAIVQAACGDDPILLREVHSLLESHAQAGEFLSSPTMGAPASTQVAPATPIVEGPGNKIGRYKLLQLIGEGGFGSVFMAEQEHPVRRRVALKIIKLGMDTEAVIARFEAERQALAMMDHPNIARVFDAGATATGRPYFVMELVRGVPITEYCDQAKLDTAQRLSLFMDVCGAVQHAHQKGIIHRDLKPSNVMITLRDDKPNVKVIDFGIAKATEQKLTEKTLFTAYGQMIGTPAYMSPEQAVMSEFDVDTRSDVYSLGVLLYELLTGSPPFDSRTLRGAGFDEMRRIIREQQPQKPSTKLSTLAEATKLAVAGQRQASPQSLCRQLHGDLDWIVLKALEKDRTRRYESASAFARDIQRHLKSEPVLAAAPTAGYRLGKFIQRNKGPAAAGAAIALLLLAGTALSTWQAVRATKAKRVAIAAVLEKDQALDSANAANRQSQKRLRQIETANDILGSIFENLDPKEIATAERPLQAILVEKLDKAAQQLQGDAIGDPLVVAAMQLKFGKSLVGLGEPDKAIALFKQALATREARVGPDDPQTLTVMGELTEAYLDAGRADLALPLAEETLKLMTARLGPDHPDTLASMNNLAEAYKASGRLDLALPLYEQTLKLSKAKLGPEQPVTLHVMGNLAGAYEDAGKGDLALPLFEEALKLSNAKLGPGHPHTLISMIDLAGGYAAAGKLDLALPLYEQTLKLAKATFGPDHPQTLMAMNNLATAYLDAGKQDLALPLFEQVLKLGTAKRGPDHPDTLINMNNLAWAYLVAGKLDLAVPLAEETLKLTKVKLGPDHPVTLTSMNTLAAAYKTTGKLELALPLFEQALKLTKAKLGADHPDTLTAMNNLAVTYQVSGKLDLALPLFEQALTLAKARLGPEHPKTIMATYHLGGAYEAAGKRDLALSLYKESLNLKTAKPFPEIAFWFDYSFHPMPGFRLWVQVDGTHWREYYPEGKFDTFSLVAASTDVENPGTVVRRQPDTGFEVLIPPIKEGAPFQYRKKPFEPWRTLSRIHVPSTLTAATPATASPATHPAAISDGHS
jgi:tetratricopeptide (TPR) repeat protein